MELEMRVIDQFVNEEGSDQERMCWRKIRSAMCEANSNAVLDDVRPLLNFVDWILESKIQLCDKRCLMKDIDTDFGNVKSNYCERESCPGLVLKLLADNVRAHFI